MRLGQQLKAEPCCITTVISSLFRSVQNRRICGLFHNRKLLREENKKKVKNWYVCTRSMYCCYPILTISKTFFINHNTQSKVAISFYIKKKEKHLS